MRILFTGGGTAGHVYPALAIADCLKKRNTEAEFMFIGREGGGENDSVVKAGLPVKTLKVFGIQRKLTPKNLKSLTLAIFAERKAAKIIKEFSPDVVVGTGGYVCWPVLHAAARMKIPTVIHESNLSPGLVTRLCAKKCDAVLLNHEKTADYLKRRDNTRVVGNPVRADFISKTKKEARDALGISNKDIFIVSFGGSGGSEKMNVELARLIAEYSAEERCVKHLHATGKKYYKSFSSINKKIGGRGCKVVPYIEDMPTALRGADIAICRCGAVTLSELALVGVASILIPSPNVTDNHQYKNAKHLADSGAAILIEESELDYEALRKQVSRLVKNPDERQRLAKCIESFANRSSASLIAKEIERIAEKSNLQ